MELSEKIRRLIRETGLSQREFSEHFGIPLRTVEDWAAGRRKPPEYIPRLIAYQIAYEKLEKRTQAEREEFYLHELIDARGERENLLES